MPVSKYITRDEFEAKHSENIKHFEVLATGVEAAVIATKDNRVRLGAFEDEVRGEFKEIKGILKSVGFNGSSELVREFLTYAPELIREGRALRQERALWEAHDLIGKNRREKWGGRLAWFRTPRRIALGALTFGAAISSIVVAVYTAFPHR